MGNADFCSRFPLKQSVPMELDQEFVRSINFSNDLPMDFVMIAKWTNDDVYLQQIMTFLRDGWPKKLDKRLMDVFANQNDLEIIDGCILYQDRVVIPQRMQSGILKLLHANHAGIVKMKQLARKQVYWFGINKDIENYVTTCEVCGSMAVVPKTKTLSHWTPTTRPFSRIHIDFFYFSRHTFLLIVDSFSKWLEVEWMKKGTDCAKVVKKLVAYFARFGLPDVLVSDGGPPFNSSSFITFLERQGIRVMKSPPYHPQSNGQAERLVRTTKEVLKKFLLEPDLENVDLEDQINLFLMNYRNNIMTSSGQLPSEKIFLYKPKTMLDLLNPKNHYKQFLVAPQAPDDDKPAISPKAIKKKSKDELEDLMEGDMVWYRNHKLHVPNRWLKAIFLKRFSKNTFQVSVGNAILMAHREQIRLHHGRESEAWPNMIMGPDTGGTNAYQSNEYNLVEEWRGAGSGTEEELLRGFPEEKPAKVVRKKRNASMAKLPEGCPRRSKRLRIKIKDKDFVYN